MDGSDSSDGGGLMENFVRTGNLYKAQDVKEELPSTIN